MSSSRRDIQAADPRRIAACLKACDGVSTERLEAGAIIRLVAACTTVDDAEVRAALEDLTSPRRPVDIKPR